MSDITIHMDGEDYSLNDFEGREIVNVERLFDIVFLDELDRGSVTGAYAMIYIIKKRGNPGLTIDDVLSMKLGEVERILDPTIAPPTVTEAPEPAEASSEEPSKDEPEVKPKPKAKSKASV